MHWLILGEDLRNNGDIAIIHFPTTDQEALPKGHMHETFMHVGKKVQGWFCSLEEGELKCAAKLVINPQKCFRWQLFPSSASCIYQ
jgi:hypothetical protein